MKFPLALPYGIVVGLALVSCNVNPGGDIPIPETGFLLHIGNDTAAAAGLNNVDVQRCWDVAADGDGNSYCAGSVTGSFAETTTSTVEDAFVMKVSAAGEIVWVTQLGDATAPGDNSGTDLCRSVAVDSLGNVYCGGETTGDLGETGSGWDAFLMKLDSSGSLVWLTQLGNSTASGANGGTERCWSIAVDSSGSVYCGGSTTGSLGETNTDGVEDILVWKVDSTGATSWVTQLGEVTAPNSNNGNERCLSIALSTNGVICGGYTDGALAETNSGNDAFVLRLNQSNGNMTWLTQFGDTTAPPFDNSGSDLFSSVAVDGSDNAYCGGQTTGDFAETGTNNDALVVKVDVSGNVSWATQLGNSTASGTNTGGDTCQGIAVDSNGDIVCAGSTTGPLGETSTGSFDAMVLKLTSAGAVSWITQLGDTTAPGSNSAADQLQGVAVDSSGNVYAAGDTVGDLGDTASGMDAIILKLTSAGKL